jgi:hypothetical protein
MTGKEYGRKQGVNIMKRMLRVRAEFPMDINTNFF